MSDCTGWGTRTSTKDFKAILGIDNAAYLTLKGYARDVSRTIVFNDINPEVREAVRSGEKNLYLSFLLPESQLRVMSAVYGKACEGGTYKSLFDRFYEPSKPAGYNKVAEWLLNCILRGSRKRTTKADEQREGLIPAVQDSQQLTQPPMADRPVLLHPPVSIGPPTNYPLGSPVGSPIGSPSANHSSFGTPYHQQENLFGASAASWSPGQIISATLEPLTPTGWLTEPVLTSDQIDFESAVIDIPFQQAAPWESDYGYHGF